jgi:rRNA-processing protein FCF1
MPALRPLPGVTLDAVIDALRGRAEAANSIRSRSGGKPSSDLMDDYVIWISGTESVLRHLLHPADVSELLHTQRSWLLRGMDQITGRAVMQVLDEVEDRARVLEAARAELVGVRDRWRDGVLVIVDTNVFLHHPREFDEIDWPTLVDRLPDIRLVVPLIVVDELDRQKQSTKNDVRRKARQTLRKLDDLLVATPPGGRARIGQTDGSKQVTTVEVFVDPFEHQRFASADAEIVDRALYLDEVSGHAVYLATGDSHMRYRAREAGLEVIFIQSP